MTPETLRVCLNPIWSKALHNFLARSLQEFPCSSRIPQLHWSVSHLTRLLRGTLVSFQLLYILLRRSCAGFFPQHLIPRAAVCGFFYT
jgi:hypothetical protein